MMFRNSLRLLMSNFYTVWKILLYKIVTTVIIFGLTTIVALPLINTLSANNFFVDLKDTLTTFMLNLNIGAIIFASTTILDSFVTIIVNNINIILPSLIGVFVMVVIVGGFLNGLSQLALADTLNGYMSSNANFSFTASFVKNFAKSVRLQLTKLIINLPINLIIVFTIYSSLSLLDSGDAVIVLFAPLIIITLSTLLFALNLTVFSGVIPAIIVHDVKIWGGFRRGIKAVSRRFFRTLSNSVVVILTILFVNVFVIIITAGAGLIITLPSSVFLLAIFGMVMYYGSMGMRYYVDPETILTPKRLEEQDKMKDTKFLI